MADAFILPSLSEGLPMVVLEAWAYGKPVLMTPECNLPEGFATNAIRIGSNSEASARHASVRREDIGEAAHRAAATTGSYNGLDPLPKGAHFIHMSAHEIIAQLPKLSAHEREMILSELVSLELPFEPSPAMEEAIREGLRSVRDERTYSADELRSRIAEWTAR